ncbi:anti-CBASS protein Acb1 family protein [Natroniella sp. ANB-PHB2]|uniref:anti-CBASS protein Acb1 family protein n=1 Tax=Natroniella sp. ANB-PHB2 TaxID=3384444 RepID=UPI0038D417EF
MADGEEIDAVEQLGRMVANSLISARSKLANKAGASFAGERNYYQTLGYKDELTFEDYWAKYDRQDIAKTIVEKPAKTTWKKKAIIKEQDKKKDDETDFEKDLATVVKNTKLFNKLKRADILSGIGRYGVILLGTADPNGNDFSKPLEKDSLNGPEDVLYLSVYSEGSAKINQWETDQTNRRFGNPKFYKIDLTGDDPPKGFKAGNVIVHHSRVIHLAEGLLENEVLGTPRLKNVYNLLDDLMKIVGGSAETYWKNASNKYHADVREEYDIDLGKLDEQIDELVHNLRDYIGTKGVDINTLTTNIEDPSNPFDIIISLISAVTGIPKRILLGSERGELASSQDERNWVEKINERRANYAQPLILEPLIEKLIEIGAVSQPETGFEVEWPNLFELNEMEESERVLNYARAINQYSGGSSELIVAPAEFREKYLGLEPEIAEEYLIGENDLLPEEEEEVHNYFKRLKNR